MQCVSDGAVLQVETSAHELVGERRGANKFEIYYGRITIITFDKVLTV